MSSVFFVIDEAALVKMHTKQNVFVVLAEHLFFIVLVLLQDDCVWG
jgi:hypothetical protein